VDPGPQYENMTNVNRFTTAGFFTVENHIVGNPIDAFPPSPVTDLRVTSATPDKGVVHLTWTAPGNNLDQGTG
jgi:hypothetical protein